jgi:hypothetical protein
MPNRTAKFVSAVFAGVIAGAPLTATTTSTPARAADECLSAPKGQTPEGGHWYYRIEHPSNRHCWHLREEDDAHAQAAPSNSPAPIKQAAAKPEAAMPGSVANARAELPSPRASLDQDAGANTGQVPAAASAATIDNNEAASLPDSNLTSSVVASRWPNQLSANAPAAPPPAPVSAGPPADLQANATPPPPPAPVAPTVPLAAADASITKQSGSAMMLLAIVVGALSVAGLVASVVFSSGKRRRGRKSFGGEALPIWDIDRDLKRGDRPLPFPRQAAARPNIGAPRELNEPDDLDDRDRIEQMLARLARSAQNPTG